MGLFDFFKTSSKPAPGKLIKAAKKGNLTLATTLLEQGVDVNCKDEKGKYGDYFMTPLLWASRNGHYELVNLFLKHGVDMDYKYNARDSALIVAFENGWVDIVKLLMDAGAKIDDNKDRDEVLTLINGRSLPLPEAQPPFPEFAEKNDISMVVNYTKKDIKFGFKISANRCTVNWGDGSDDESEYNLTKKEISHFYDKAGSYIVTINAEDLSTLKLLYDRGFYAQTKEIYLNNCPQLKELYCGELELTSLDISRCPELEILICHYNKLTSLDISKNLSLNYLSCAKNLLACLDISGNTKLTDVDCSGNQLSILNVSRNNEALARLQCDDNKLSVNELHLIFNQLPNYNSSYGTVSTWYGGQTSAKIFIACGKNPGFDACNAIIAYRKNWLVWIKAMYVGETLTTPGHWQEDFING